MYTIGEMSKISGVSVRTLHYYDEIGLLSPIKEQNGYRKYSEKELDKLQQIMFYKCLKFSLHDIINILNDNVNHVEILIRQRELIKKEKDRFDQLLKTIDKTIEHIKGEKTMTVEEKFVGFKHEDLEKYEERAMKKYGKEVIAEAKRRRVGIENIANEEFNNVFKTLAKYKADGLGIDDKKIQEEIDKLYNHINKYGFDCTLEVFSFIGKGYGQNPEFRNNINKFGIGVAEFTSEAIGYYYEKTN